MLIQPYYENPSSNKRSYYENKAKDYSWIFVGLIVLILHGVVPWLAGFSMSKPEKAMRQKVIVQTINLAPTDIPALPALISPGELPNELPKELPEIQNEIEKETSPLKSFELTPSPLPLPEPEIQKNQEEMQAKTETRPIIAAMEPDPQEIRVQKEAPKNEITPPCPQPKKEDLSKSTSKGNAISAVSIQKKEILPEKPTPPKKTPPKPQIKPEKKSASAKKSVPEQPKKKTEIPKESKEQIALLEQEKKKQVENAQKKQQDLKNKLAEEKKQKELQDREAEKKRQQESAKKEAEKKRQLEIEAERKKQEELAAKETARCQALMAKARENLIKNQEIRNKTSSSPGLSLQNTAIPATIENLHIDNLQLCIESASSWTAKEINYRDEICNVLHAALRLPEYGSIKIELTINKNGKVEKVKFLSSESAKNKQYIERKVSDLEFPAFGNRFQESSECTFSITLKNQK